MQKSAQLPEMSLTITFEELVSRHFQQEGKRRYHGIDVIFEEPYSPPHRQQKNWQGAPAAERVPLDDGW